MALVTYRVEGGAMRDVWVGIGGIEEKPRRVSAAEAALEGQAPGAEAFRAAGEATLKDVDPMVDVSTPAEYRRDLSAVVVRRALEAAAANLAKKN